MINTDAIAPPIVADAALGPDELDAPRQSGRTKRIKGVAEHTATPPADETPAATPVNTDAWLSIGEFKGEVVPPLPATAFAGFALAVRSTKHHNYRNEWRKLLNEWLRCEGYSERV